MACNLLNHIPLLMDVQICVTLANSAMVNSHPFTLPICCKIRRTKPSGHVNKKLHWRQSRMFPELRELLASAR